MNKPIGYIDVDRLQAETTLQESAAKCGFPLEVKGSGPEVRIDCPLGCPCDHSGRKEIAINTENPQKIFQCHSYVCGFRGNLLTLMHGFLTGSKPTGGKLKGDEFQRVKKVLAGIGQPRNQLFTCVSSRQGRLKIAHRFNGGLRTHESKSPVRDGRHLSSLTGLSK